MKLGCAWVYLFCLIFAPKHRLWVLVWRFFNVFKINVLSKNKKNTVFPPLKTSGKTLYITWVCFRRDFSVDTEHLFSSNSVPV